MYKGGGAGRWADFSEGARDLPYRRPACVRTAARMEEPEGTRSLLCWPCRAAAAAAVWTGMEEALMARPPLGQRSSPLVRRPPHVCRGGARADNVRHRPGGLRLRPRPTPRGELSPRQRAAAQGR